MGNSPLSRSKSKKGHLPRRLTGEHPFRAPRADRTSASKTRLKPTKVMSRTISSVTGKPYGLALVCRVWRLARSGVYRHLSEPPARGGRFKCAGAQARRAIDL